MRVLYYHQHFSTPRGAIGNRSYAFARRLVEAGHDVTLVCGSYANGNTGLTGPFRSGRRTGMVDGIRVIEYSLPYSNADGLVRRALIFLRFAFASLLPALRRDYDVVFATTTPLTAGIPGILAKLLRRKPFVFEVRDLWPELPRAMGVITNPAVLTLLDWLEWASYRSADALIGLSPGIVDGIARRGVARDRIAMVPNGCDLDTFAQPERRPIPGVPEGAVAAVFTGAHGPANGLDAVLDAGAVLKRRGRSDIRLVFIGDGRLKRHLVRRAETERLDNCLFLDPVPKPVLAGYLKAAQIGMQILQNVPAFYYGTSPNKFFDYLAVGLPVLTNYPGWIADLVRDFECGAAVPPDDPEAFADGLERLADDPDARARFGANALKLGTERFNRDRLAAEFLQVVTAAAQPAAARVRPAL